MTVEEKLESIDFAQFSKVKKNLWLRLKLRHAADNEQMSMEELDYVAAAGVPAPKKPDENSNA